MTSGGVRVKTGGPQLDPLLVSPPHWRQRRRRRRPWRGRRRVARTIELSAPCLNKKHLLQALDEEQFQLTLRRPFSLYRRRHRNRTGAEQRVDAATAGRDINISHSNASEIATPPPPPSPGGGHMTSAAAATCDQLVPPSGHTASCCQEPGTSRDILCRFSSENVAS